MNLNMVPKMGPPGGPIWDRMRSLVKEERKHFHGPILGPSGGTKIRPQNRKSTAKADPSKQKLQLRLSQQKTYRFGTEEARTCEA